MRIIAIGCLKSFWERYPEVEQPLRSWIDEVKNAEWAMPSDIKRLYSTASVLKGRRVVFNIKGNEYRLVVAIAYQYQSIYIKFIGTHRQYDAVDANSVEMEW